jgi:hypothetical protein
MLLRAGSTLPDTQNTPDPGPTDAATGDGATGAPDPYPYGFGCYGRLRYG